MSREADLAWAAGFWDGEGYAGIHRILGKKAAKRVTCTLVQVDRRVLDRFCGIVGVGKVRGPYKTNNGRPAYQWSDGGKYACTAAVFDLLRPYLSEVKTEQFLNCLKEYEEYQRTTKYAKTSLVFRERQPTYLSE